MKSFILPKGIQENINRKMRNFFWCHDNNNRKFHSINWKKICTPKALVGLGIRNPEHQNKVLFLNLVWKLNQSPKYPWAQVLINKYGSFPLGKKSNSSYAFRCIQKILPLFNSCIRWIPRDGQKINLWYDTGLNQSLRKQIHSPLPQNEESRAVSSIIKTNTNTIHWNLTNLPFTLPHPNNSQEDQLSWI